VKLNELGTLALVSLILISGFIIGGETSINSSQTELATGITITIDYGNGTAVVHPNVEGTDVLNATQSIANLELEWFSELAYVTGIDGASNDRNLDLWWQCWVNGEYASIAVNLFSIEDGDRIVWRRTSALQSSTGLQSLDDSTVGATFLFGVLGVSLVVVLFYVKRR